MKKNGGTCANISYLLYIELFEENFVCLQVEFNKAAQSLTDAMIPSTQRKTALSRLVKVRFIDILHAFLPLVEFQSLELSCWSSCIKCFLYRITLPSLLF